MMLPNWLWKQEWVRSEDGYLSWLSLGLVLLIVAALGALSAWACLAL